MQIRLFETKDAQAIAALIALLLDDTIKEVKDSANTIIYVAEEKTKIVGCAQLQTDGYIDYFYCHKDYQRCGVGTRLYRAIEAKALELKIKNLFVEASVSARAFFKSRGFAVIQERQIISHGKKFNKFAMKKELSEYLQRSQDWVVATFYHFTDLADYKSMRPLLTNFCHQHQLKGTILLAQEGINSTIAGSREAIDALLNYLREDLKLPNLEHKETYCDVLPYQKLQVKLKKELVKFGVSDIDPSREVGIYVEAQDWNQLISDPDVLVIDTRNIYELEFGTFKGAIDPNIEFFHEFPKYVEENLQDHKQKKIAMFCTGGIRCEKASAYMLAQGFDQVYHLKGGIIKYLAEVPSQQSLWEGQCFVFDDRIALD
jgi:UPF0176 protein